MCPTVVVGANLKLIQVMHYFLHCDLYEDQRRGVISSIEDIHTECGIQYLNLSPEHILNHIIHGFAPEFENKNILLFSAVQQYILLSGRFN
jgi:hypothetical protein